MDLSKVVAKIQILLEQKGRSTSWSSLQATRLVIRFHIQHHWGSTFYYPLIIDAPFKGGGKDTALIGAEAPVTPKKMQITMLSCIFFINESKSKTYLTDSTPLYFRPGVKVIPGNSNQVVIKVINALICFHLWKSIQLTLWAYQDWTRERNQPALNAFLSPEISPGESGKALDYN